MGPAGVEIISLLLALKSTSVNSLSSLRYTSTKARSILVASTENILNAAGVGSDSASDKSILEIRLLVTSSAVAFEYSAAVSQSQSPTTPLIPARKRVVFFSLVTNRPYFGLRNPSRRIFIPASGFSPS